MRWISVIVLMIVAACAAPVEPDPTRDGGIGGTGIEADQPV